jgi:hypothetical protein
MRWSVIGILPAIMGLELACRAGGSAATQDLHVYVPPGSTAGDSGNDSEAGAGFSLGQVDRAGRPLVAMLLMPPSLEDDYNAAPTFDTPLSRTLEDALSSRLGALDTIGLADGGQDPTDWIVPDGAVHPLLPIVSLDALLIDPALSSSLSDGGFASTYFDLEREALLPDAGHSTCGGRTPNDDVVDSMLTLLVTRNRAPIAQGISGPAKPAATVFPYFADPN